MLLRRVLSAKADKASTKNERATVPASVSM
jgi:hypothetical protein